MAFDWRFRELHDCRYEMYVASTGLYAYAVLFPLLHIENILQVDWMCTIIWKQFFPFSWYCLFSMSQSLQLFLFFSLLLYLQYLHLVCMFQWSPIRTDVQLNKFPFWCVSWFVIYFWKCCIVCYGQRLRLRGSTLWGAKRLGFEVLKPFKQRENTKFLVGSWIDIVHINASSCLFVSISRYWIIVYWSWGQVIKYVIYSCAITTCSSFCLNEFLNYFLEMQKLVTLRKVVFCNFLRMIS